MKTIFSISTIIESSLKILRGLIVRCKNRVRNIYRNEYLIMRWLITQLSIHPCMSILIFAFHFIHIKISTSLFRCYATLILTKTFDSLDFLFQKFDFIIHVYLSFFISKGYFLAFLSRILELYFCLFLDFLNVFNFIFSLL